MSESRHLIDKLWSYCNVLRDDGVGVIEYTEQLTYLLFLKMAHERATRKLNLRRSSRPSTPGNGRREWIAGSETFGAWESRGVEQPERLVDLIYCIDVRMIN